jgi:hypothetical protein
MDAFRVFQKQDGRDGSPKRRNKYGCSCCRKLSYLNHFKKMSRKHAKGKFRTQTRKMIANGPQEGS